MSQFLSFIKENKELIISALTLALTLVCVLVKRKPKTLDEFTLAVSDVVSCVAVLVSKVEKPGEGQSKKNEVLNIALHLVSQKLGRKLSNKEREILIDKVSEQIEEVLKAPQKKVC